MIGDGIGLVQDRSRRPLIRGFAPAGRGGGPAAPLAQKGRGLRPRICNCAEYCRGKAVCINPLPALPLPCADARGDFKGEGWAGRFRPALSPFQFGDGALPIRALRPWRGRERSRTICPSAPCPDPAWPLPPLRHRPALRPSPALQPPSSHAPSARARHRCTAL